MLDLNKLKKEMFEAIESYSNEELREFILKERAIDYQAIHITTKMLIQLKSTTVKFTQVRPATAQQCQTNVGSGYSQAA